MTDVKTEVNDTTVVPVGDIRLQLGDKAIVFVPSDDITGKEVALVFQMFLNGIMQRGGTLDFGSFIVKNNLQKHFAEIKDEPQEGQEAA